jgi:hypothetical protein
VKEGFPSCEIICWNGKVCTFVDNRRPAGEIAMNIAYEEFIDFIAAGTTPDTIIAFRPSEEARTRVMDLIRRQKTTGLSPDETAELNHYLHTEHVMRLAKARARQHLSTGQ